MFCGVPQGSVLGPLLYIMVNTANISMYADDTDLSARITNGSDISSKLVPEFLEICEWLSLNALKIEFMIIGSHHRVNLGQPERYQLQGLKTKSLRLVTDEFLTWDNHIEFVAKKIKNLGMMKKIKGSVPKDSLVTLYKTLVEPYLKYCNIICGQCGNTLVEKVQTLQIKLQEFYLQQAWRRLTTMTY